MSHASAKTTAEIASAIRPHPLTQANVLVRDPQVLRDAAQRLLELEAEITRLRERSPPSALTLDELWEKQGFEKGAQKAARS